MIKLVLWLICIYMAGNYIIDALQQGIDWRLVLGLVTGCFGAGFGLGLLFYKNRIDRLKERIATKDDRIKTLEFELVNRTPNGLTFNELTALRHIRNWQVQNPQLNYWGRHTSPETLAQWMQIELHQADEIIKELKSKNYVEDDAFRGTYPVPGRAINLSDPVVLTAKGHREIGKHAQ